MAKDTTCAEAGRKRWSKTTKKERTRLASEAGKSVSPEAAKARAFKMWATRRKLYGPSGRRQEHKKAG